MKTIFALGVLGMFFVAPDAPAGDLVQSCRNDVQGFYSWYAPLAVESKGDIPSWIVATQQKSFLFSKQLIKALQEDRAAQQKAQDIVGLDFDPFLNSQDPDLYYVVRDASVKDGSCRINISRRQALAEQSVSAELRYSRGNWVFTNFYYPKDGKPAAWDLLGLLAELSAGRDKSVLEYNAAAKLADQGQPEGFLRLYKIASQGDSAELSEIARDKLCELLYSKTGLWLRVFSAVDRVSFRKYLRRGGLATLEYPKGIASEEEYSKAVLERLGKYRTQNKEADLSLYLESLLKEDLKEPHD